MRRLVNHVLRSGLLMRHAHRISRMWKSPHELQNRMRWRLLRRAEQTEWGRRHAFRDIRSARDFAQAMPVRDYDYFQPLVERMMYGEPDVLWPGRVRWFSKSSGTTSTRSKFIPVPQINLCENHKRGTWDSLTVLYHQLPAARLFAYRSMIMGGALSSFTPHPDTTTGDVSAIMLHHLPRWARFFFLPDVETALLPDWEEKLERMARAGANDPSVVMIGGVPTWTVVLFRRILELTGKAHMLEVWPDFQVYIHGGVSFLPYRAQFREFFPSDQVSYQEIYNASEGYFAVQDLLDEDGMLLLLDNGIYYEFLPMEEWQAEQPKAVGLAEVKPGKHYALVVSTSGGLWRYMPGDTVMFTSLHPYRIKVTGRTKQFINAFGEEVMVDNTDKALAQTCQATGAVVVDYTVAPQYLARGRKGGHQWLVEFEREPGDIAEFSDLLDRNLQRCNSDYEAKRYHSLALERLQLVPLPKGTFHNWLRTKGKLGGQHKVPRLANHRQYVDDILHFLGEHV